MIYLHFYYFRFQDVATVSLKGWALKKTVNGVNKHTYTFGDISLSKGKEIKVLQ